MIVDSDQWEFSVVSATGNSNFSRLSAVPPFPLPASPPPLSPIPRSSAFPIDSYFGILEGKGGLLAVYLNYIFIQDKPVLLNDLFVQTIFHL